MNKKIVSVNLGNYGSTGKIMYGLSNLAESRGFEAYCCYPHSNICRPPRARDLIICDYFWLRVYAKLAYFSGLIGYMSFFSTLRLIRKLKRLKPDLIHFHNLHNSYINLPLLFHYIKKEKIPVVWTLHDCWSFTGRCPHFVIAQCDRWRTGCHDCPYPPRSYPAARWDLTAFMWKHKQKMFTGVKNLTLVTPSQWLVDLVKESYLKDYPVQVIYNGIDLAIFHPTSSNFREQHRLEGKYIVLGVAMPWSDRKGMDVMVKLSQRLPEQYQIVLVGTDDQADKQLPDKIISIHRTNNQQELAELYTAADVLANPTREEVLGMVNIEALACGTPVVTFDTGGSPETLDDSCGLVVPCDDVDAMEQAVRRVCEKKLFPEEACLKRAKAFDMDKRFEEYMGLYRSVIQ